MICVVWWHLVLFLGGWLLVAIGGHVLGFTYWLRLWRVFDIGMNAVLAGDDRETISSRLGKAQRRGSKFAAVACAFLHLIDRAHCRDSIDEELGARRVPVGMAVVGLFFIVFSVLLYVAA